MTACSTVAPSTDAEALIPTALTTCADAPAVPPRPGPDLPRTDDVKAAYDADLFTAFSDCKGVVHAVAVRRTELDKQYAKPGFHFSWPFGKKAPAK